MEKIDTDYFIALAAILFAMVGPLVKYLGQRNYHQKRGKYFVYPLL